MVNDELIKNILGSSYNPIGCLKNFVYKFNPTSVDLTIEYPLENYLKLSGVGIDLFDATFFAFKNYFSKEYTSLHSVELDNFSVGLDRKITKKYTGSLIGSASECLVKLSLRTATSGLLYFNSTGCDIIASVAFTVSRAVEYLINSERAYIALQRALEDAMRRNRQDLVEKYTRQLADIVKYTDYRDIKS